MAAGNVSCKTGHNQLYCSLHEYERENSGGQTGPIAFSDEATRSNGNADRCGTPNRLHEPDVASRACWARGPRSGTARTRWLERAH